MGEPQERNVLMKAQHLIGWFALCALRLAAAPWRCRRPCPFKVCFVITRRLSARAFEVVFTSILMRRRPRCGQRPHGRCLGWYYRLSLGEAEAPPQTIAESAAFGSASASRVSPAPSPLARHLTPWYSNLACTGCITLRRSAAGHRVDPR